MHLLETAAHWAWDTSLAASILIIPALLTSLFLRKPVFTPIRHMLGLLIIARLLLPFTVQSPLSIFNILQSEASWSAASPRRFQFQRPSLSTTPGIPTPIPSSAPSPAISFSSQATLTPTPKRIPSLSILWAIGVLAILARVTFQHLKIRRFTGPANQITSGPAIDALTSALELSRCRRAIKLYSVPNLSTPALFSLFHPSILLPADLAQSADFRRLRLVCLHEIAHLKRLDVLINWFMIFAQTLHWFNPLVWLTMRRLRADQELLCDADVLRILHPDERHAYGDTLLALASPRHYAFSTLIPVSSSFKQLKERIAMIKQFKPVTNRLLLFTVPSLAGIIAILTFTAAANKQPAKAPPAAQKSASLEDEKKKRVEGIELLQNQLDEQAVRVQQAETLVDDLRKQLRLPPVATESELFNAESEASKQIELDRIRAEQEYVQFNHLLKDLKSRSQTDVVQIMPTANADEALNKLLENLRDAQQRVVKLKVGYDDAHPLVQSAAAEIKEINRQIDARVMGILSGLETIVSARKAIVDELAKKSDATVKAQAERAESARPYFRALRDLEVQREFRKVIQLRLMQERIDSALAR